jgi:hypothetical protein
VERQLFASDICNTQCPLFTGLLNDAKLTDTVEKGFLTIATADPIRALKTLRLLIRRECSVSPSFSAVSTLCYTTADEEKEEPPRRLNARFSLSTIGYKR